MDAANERATTARTAPLVTIGLPVYNAADRLRETLDNLLQQTLADFDLVISDNASTDSTAGICEAYAASDPRITVIHQKVNIGAARNWNAVFHPARGRYFKWAAANDLCAPTMLEQCVEVLEHDVGAVLCYGRTELVDDDGNRIKVYEGDMAVGDEQPWRRFGYVINHWDLNNAQQAVIRTDALRRTGLDRVFPGGDEALMVELALHGRFVLLPDVLLRRAHSVSSTVAMRGPAETQRVYFPTRTHQIRFVAWRHHLDWMASIARAPITPAQKLLASSVALRMMVASRRTLAKEALSLLRPPVPLRPPSAPVGVGLYGMYRSANLGDWAIQRAVIDGLTRSLGQTRFVGICADPDDTRTTLGIAAVGWWGIGPTVDPDGTVVATGGRRPRWHVTRVVTAPLRRFAGMIRVVDELDLLVISGGGQLSDYWGGLYQQPLRLLMWVAAARWSHVPIAVLGAGVDGLSPRGTRFVVWAMRLAHFRAFRDQGSLEMLRQAGLTAASTVCPDPALGLLPGSTGVSSPAPATAPMIVISPISKEAWGENEDAEHYDQYIDSLVVAARQLAGDGAEIVVVCSQPRMDGPIADMIVRSVGSVADVRCPDEFLAVAASASVVIAARLHALILAMVAGAPVVAIAPTPKQHQLMADADLTEFLLELNDLRPAQIVARVHDAMTRQDELRAHVQAWVAASRSSLDATYDQLVEAVRGHLAWRGVRLTLPERR